MTRPAFSTSKNTQNNQEQPAQPLPPPKGITRSEQSTSFSFNGVYPSRHTIAKPRPVSPAQAIAPTLGSTAESIPETAPVLTSGPPSTGVSSSSAVVYKPVSVAEIKALSSALAAAKQAAAQNVPAEPKTTISTPPVSAQPQVPPSTGAGSGGSPHAFPAPQVVYTDANKVGLQRRSIRESKQSAAPLLETPSNSQDFAYFDETRFADESKDSPPAHRHDEDAASTSPVPPLESMDTEPAPDDSTDYIDMYDDDDLVIVGGRRGSPRGNVVKDVESQLSQLSQPEHSQLEPRVLLIEDIDGPTHTAFVAELRSSSPDSMISTGTADTSSTADDTTVRVSRAPSAQPAISSGAIKHTMVVLEDSHGGAVQSASISASQAQCLTTVSKIIQAVTEHRTESSTAGSGNGTSRQQGERAAAPGPVLRDSSSSSAQGSVSASSASSIAGSDRSEQANAGNATGNGALQSVIDVPRSLDEITGAYDDDESSDSDGSDVASVQVLGTTSASTNKTAATERSKEYVAFAYTRTTMGQNYAMLGIGMVCSVEGDKMFLVIMRPSDPARPASAEYVMEWEENVIVGTNVVLARNLAFENGARGGVLDAPSQQKIQALLRKYTNLQVDTHITAF